MKMAESSPNGWKTLWKKEKLLITSNFSLSLSGAIYPNPTVFSKDWYCVLQTHKNQGLFGKGLNIFTIEIFAASVFEIIHVNIDKQMAPLFTRHFTQCSTLYK